MTKLIICFVNGLSVSSTSRILGIRRGTVTNYFDDCQAEWMNSLTTHPIRFEDNGEYEVDELYIRHVRVGRQRRYKNIWVAGILERATGKIMLYQVDDKSKGSLIPPIQENVPHGSFVYSDSLPTYNRLNTLEYSHYTVNHSAREFSRLENINGETINVHINTLEGINHAVRQAFKNKSSRNSERVDLILAELMYRRSGRDLFHPFKV